MNVEDPERSRRDASLDLLRQAISNTPDNIPLRKHFAATLEQAGRLEEARDEYREILTRTPSDEASLLALGRVLNQLGRSEEAAARLTELLRANSRNAEAHLLMARAMLALRQHERAQKHYQMAMDLDASLADRQMEAELFTEGEERPQVAREMEAQQVYELGVPVEAPRIGFEDVGGMEELKEDIRVNMIYPFLHPEVYAAYGKKVGGGILLYGPPGCGKTYIARATAGECKARFIAVGIEDVLDMWIGQSEQKLHALFELARHATPTILFFDELEALAGKRSGMETHHYRTLVNQFLAEMDGARGDNSGILILGATNSPWHVDPAFRRPGRFDRVIFVPPPDRLARVEILKVHCRNKPVEDISYEKLAGRMKRFSGADIQAVCDAAAEIALKESLKTGRIRKLNDNDFLNALKSIRPTVDEWLNTARNYATYANQTGLYDPVAEYLQKPVD